MRIGCLREKVLDDARRKKREARELELEGFKDRPLAAPGGPCPWWPSLVVDSTLIQLEKNRQKKYWKQIGLEFKY